MTTTRQNSGRSAPPIGKLLRELDRLIDERFERTLGQRAVTRRQWQLLSTLDRGETALVDLSAAVAPFLDQAVAETAESHLAPLLGRGWVEHSGDRYRLTAAGRVAVEELAEEVRATRELTVAGISSEAYEQTVRTLQAMIDNLRCC